MYEHMSANKSPTISIDWLPRVTEQGNWPGGVGLPADMTAEITRGCAELLDRLGELAGRVEVIKVFPQKEQREDESWRLEFCATLSGFMGQEKIKSHTVIDSVLPDSLELLAEIVVNKLGFEIGLSLRNLSSKYREQTERLKTLAPFAFNGELHP